MEAFTVFGFLFSIGALWYAVRTERKMSRILALIESKNYTTVTIDHTDGRITVLQREYGTDLQRPSVREP